MWPFTPKYLKHGKLLLKGVQRFINYKRDILPTDKLTEISTLRDALAQALKSRDKAKIESLHDVINSTCERSLPDLKNSEIAENVEVFFVAIVIAIGIRSYIAQPFQIPTGSMQPTLNGINCTELPPGKEPTFTEQFTGWFTGYTYVNAVSPRDGLLRRKDPITQRTWDFSLTRLSISILTPHTVLNFADGGTVVIKGPRDKVLSDLGLGQVLALPSQRYGPSGPDMKETTIYDPDSAPLIEIKKGQQLARGIIHWGDNVLVNKFAYHFRAPTRGEVFVFTTKNIRGIRVAPEEGSQHYIKRLVGVPGDDLEVKSPTLWINGKPAPEFGIDRVSQAKGPYRGYSNVGYLQEGRHVTLSPQEYWAMGDNSYNSSDSRYWGHVPQSNIVGPGMFCYFPFASHWGIIW